MKQRYRITARRLSLAGILILVISLAGVVLVPGARWRAHVILLHALGRIPDITMREMLTYMMPGSDQTMAFLIDTRNPYAVVRNFRTSPTDLQAGKKLFQSRCGVCHAPDGGGGAGGPALSSQQFKHGISDWAVYRTIRLGIPKTAMPAHAMAENEIWQIITFLRAIDGSKNGPAAAAPNPATSVKIHVPYEELAATTEAADDWLTYSGSYPSWRHSGLTQITPRNVSSLSLKWIHQLKGDHIDIQTSPVVRNGVMFITVPPGRVMALNADTGETIWTFDHEVPSEVRGGEFGTMQNRGVALLDDKLFVTTVDAHLLALSPETGKLLWDTVVADDFNRFYISSAPLVYRDMVVTGVATKAGGQGFLAAYEARTGKQRWRFVAIPRPGEPGSETWAGDSAKEGGAPTWLTGSYDPKTDLLIWGVGNPKPDYDPSLRKGDNLYTNSVVALRGSTGELAWYFQFTPGDDRDWDACQIPILADLKSPSGIDRRLLWANRNGFYYVLDRVSGKYISAQPFVQQTWTDGLDANGRPKPLSVAPNSQEGSLVYPGNVGGTNWWSPSFDPALSLVFVPVLEQGMVYFSSAASTPKSSGRSFYTAVRALNAATGERVWEHRREPRFVDNRMGSLLSTKSGLVFGSDQTNFFSLDSRTGALLWSVRTGGKIGAAPVTYAVHNEQVVVITAGRDVMAFSLPVERSGKVQERSASKRTL